MIFSIDCKHKEHVSRDYLLKKDQNKTGLLALITIIESRVDFEKEVWAFVSAKNNLLKYEIPVVTLILYLRSFLSLTNIRRSL